jgi:hypothetical protein
VPRADGRRFELVVRALPGGGPVEARLRRALKVLLRAFGLRCERAVELPPAKARPAELSRPDDTKGV